jgi:ATP-binding cassette subfamily C protein
LYDDLMVCVGQEHRGGLFALYVMMVITAGLEALCAALFVPFTAMLADPSYADKVEGLKWLFALCGAHTLPQQLIACGAMMGLAFGAKNIFAVYFIHKKSFFIRSCHAARAQELLSGYFHRDYLYHVQRNSSTIIRNVNNDIGQIFTNVIPGVLTILVDMLMSGVLLALMLWSMPWQGWLVMGVFGATCVWFYRISQRKNVKIGAEQRRYSGEMMKWAIQGLGSIKETKVMNKEGYFLRMFEAQMTGFVRSSATYSVIRELPKLFIELTGVVVMLVITVILVYKEQDHAVVLPTLSLFAVSTFRMLPALNRITAALSSIQFFRVMLHGLCEDLRASRAADTEGAPPVVAPFERVIALEDVHFKYPGGADEVLKGMSFEVRRGESVALVGSSGAGKTTAVDLLLGLLQPDSGRVLVDGRALPARAASWQRQIGYISQPIYLLDDSVRRNVAFGLSDQEIDDARVWAALAQAQLDEIVRAMPEGLDTRLGEVGVRLSGGQRQRIGIARVLYRDPPILIFDEATSALDAVTEQEITQAVERLHGDKTLILIAHRLSTVRKCDRILMLHNGVVEAEGTFESLQLRSARFAQMVRMHELEAEAMGGDDGQV